MKLEKAIYVLQSFLELVKPGGHPDIPDALKLGIEALKRVKGERTGYEIYAPDLLPGETD